MLDLKVDHLNVGVAQAYLNQKRLDLEAKNLNTNANNFNKQTQQWLTLIESFTSSLKVINLKRRFSNLNAYRRGF